MRRGFLSGLIAPLLLALAAVSLPAPAGAVELDPEIDRLEKNIELKAQEIVKTYLGNDAKAFITARVREVNSSAGGSKVAGEQEVDILYAPMSLSPQLSRISPDGSKRIRIEAVEVEIQLAGELEASVLDGVKALVSSWLKGLNPRVTVTKIALPKKPAPTAEELAAAEKGEGLKPPPLWVILSALGVLLGFWALGGFGILFVGNSLRNSASILSQGISSAFGKTSPGGADIALRGSEDNPIVLSHMNSGGGHNRPASGSKTPNVSGSLREFSRNIRIVKEAVTQLPILIIQAIQNEEQDLKGIKWLLPNLSTEEQEQLKRYLGPARLARIADLEDASGSMDMPQWLQDFVERIVLRKMRERSFVERALGSEKTMALFVAKPRHLIESAHTVNNSASWRILSEFLPKEEFEQVMGSMKADDWTLLIGAASVDEAAIAAAADRIIQHLSTAFQNEGVTDERSRYYSKVILDPVLRSMQQKDLTEEGAFLDELESKAPELATLVHEKVWTIKDLDRIPDEAMGLIVRGLKNEERLALCLALPEPYSERVLSMLPPGNVSIIIKDQLEKARKRANATELKAAAELTRKVLETLRKRHRDGQLKLKENATTEGQSWNGNAQAA